MSAVLPAALLGIGLLIGSFLNVVAYRVPIGLSVVSPPSSCPGCGNAIAPYDNMPVLSWLLLRGACRACRMRIPVRYPLVEAATGIAFLVVAVRFLPGGIGPGGPTTVIAGALELIAFLYLASVSVALTVIDLDVRRLPDRVVLPAYAVGALLLGAADLLRGDPVAVGTMAAGAGASFLFYLLLAVAKPGGMGLGDVKLAGVLGIFLGHLGVASLVVGIAAAFVLGGVFGALLLATRHAARGASIPFGPWMIAGAWAGILGGDAIAAVYLHVVGLG